MKRICFRLQTYRKQAYVLIVFFPLSFVLYVRARVIPDSEQYEQQACSRTDGHQSDVGTHVGTCDTAFRQIKCSNRQPRLCANNRKRRPKLANTTYCYTHAETAALSWTIFSSKLPIAARFDCTHLYLHYLPSTP